MSGSLLSYLWLFLCSDSGPSCSKLTVSLVKLPLKLILKYGIYANIFAEKMWVAFAFAKATHIFSKSTCELDIVHIRTVNILTTNELVKLTMLWTTGLRSLLATLLCINLMFMIILFYHPGEVSLIEDPYMDRKHIYYFELYQSYHRGFARVRITLRKHTYSNI